MQEDRLIVRMMGTIITLTITHPNPAPLLRRAGEMLKDFERRYNANDPASDLMQINQNAGIQPVRVAQDLFDLIKTGRSVSISSCGAFNIAIGPLIKLWRIGFEDARVPAKDEVENRLKLIDPSDIELDESRSTVFLRQKGMEIDLGALAKGYFADKLKEFFRSNGVGTGLIDLGGNVLTIGASPSQPDHYWRVGIQDPFQPRGALLAVLAVQDQSVVTSGIYERTLRIGDRIYHHIFDSRTGYPIENDVASVTIVSNQSIDGEIWTTLLFARNAKDGIDRLNTTEGIEGIIISKEAKLYVSDQLKGRVALIK